MRRASSGLSVVVAICALALSACAPRVTFPPTSGESLINTTLPPVPQVMVAALKASYAYTGGIDQPPLVFNLPPGTHPVTWKDVQAKLGGDARAMQPGDSTVWSVEALRINGGKAEVDMVVPKGSVYQFVTVHLKAGDPGKWKTDFVQPWTLRTDPPACHAPTTQ